MSANWLRCDDGTQGTRDGACGLDKNQAESRTKGAPIGESQ